ncbi:MAG: ATP phosphoribosyltransferase [Acidimicrobiia bacterium]|nr:ATP phosphoribosyltransferase [Acidimicrobiia bacterium]MDH3396977.1 ATP phosphoribosyltransferase [Acidimicrobiia bacterium]
MTALLRLAVPNKGRLQAPTAGLLSQAGLIYERTERSLSAPVANVDMELLFVRAEDVCEMVADGVAALGVTGLDLLQESGADLQVVGELGFGTCRLTAAVPNASPIQNLVELEGMRVATAHLRVTGEFFAKQGIDMTVIPLRGSVEVAPKLDVADAIVDLVSSGSTMMVNGLRPIATLLESQAVLVARSAVEGLTDGQQQVVTMLQAAVAARQKRYVVMNAPRDALRAIEEIIPGIEAPSVVPLAHNDKVAIHSVVDAKDVWQVLPRLKEAGATGILVLPVESLIA